ncbi:MAG: hypothetical protein BYD32DRAFT_466694 [Podila humilis]|nr:MAG: hypothetical protein BYD32DRAFT_466694 [Podila humilis]
MKLIQLCILGALATLAASSPITMTKRSNVATSFSNVEKREEPAADPPVDCNTQCAQLCDLLFKGDSGCISDCLPGCQEEEAQDTPGGSTEGASVEEGSHSPAESAGEGSSGAGSTGTP